MKLYRRLFTLFLLLSFNTAALLAQSQSGVDSTGLPGDHFSLQGALQLFSQSASIEDFEKALNLESNHVNNLDLNGDGETDYIRVTDQAEKDAHAFVLQVPVSATESQDIAVIELEKTGDTSAIAQIVGDEEIYGEAVIVEPDGGGEDDSFINYNNSRLSGPNAGYDEGAPRILINVWVWPSVRFVYGPVYRPWISPWRWNYYPAWWRPWRPFAWHVWHPFRFPYHRSFVIVHTHRVLHAHRVYMPFRSSSVTVRTRNSASVGHYRVTHTRTSVTGPRGKTTTVKKTTVTGPRGGKATRVKVRRH
ncbi:MAG: hypothetical protein HYZ15_16300 [Sphingobacteriales bacterium]|nr:hypothetical protein [Sphingobacteriales bacterium]